MLMQQFRIFYAGPVYRIRLIKNQNYAHVTVCHDLTNIT